MRLLSLTCVAVVAWVSLFVCGFATPAAAREIGVFGDSLGDGVWSGLYTVLKAHPEDHLFRDSKIGAGLTRPDFQSWFSTFAAQLDEQKITDAVVMFGANDE